MAGIGDLYQGALSPSSSRGRRSGGGGLSARDLRAALPKTVSPLVVTSGRDRVAFLPPPADGGLAAAAAFRRCERAPADLQAANARALAVAARFRAGGADPASLLRGAPSVGGNPCRPCPPPRPSPRSTAMATPWFAR